MKTNAAAVLSISWRPSSTVTVMLRLIGCDGKASSRSRSERPGHRLRATYDYLDENGVLLFQVVRFEPKDFRPRRPDGRFTLEGVRRVLYRLPELRRAVADGRIVYVCEGEKDADNVHKLGFAATTNAGGANKWRDEYTVSLRGADVVLLPHNDDPGRKHSDVVAGALNDIAKRVRILDIAEHLAGLPGERRHIGLDRRWRYG